MVNVAYDAPVDLAPREQIEDAERRLYELAETGRYDGGFQRFAQALTTAVDMAARAYQRDGKLSGLATGLNDLDRKMGGLQRPTWSSSPAAPAWARPRSPPTSPTTSPRPGAARCAPDGHIATVNGGIVGFFSLEMSAEQLATRIIAEQTGIPSSTHPPRRHHRSRFRTHQGCARSRCRRCRSTSTRPAACRSRSSPPARGGSSASAGLDLLVDRLHPAAAGLAAAAPTKAACRRSPRSPPASRRWPRSSTFRSWRCRSSRVRSKAATTSARSSPTCVNRARSSRTPTWCCSCSARNIT